ncbi:hypothetical protein [Streptomyces humidus]|nr:hypothetical protein [Streptomyces humidus]
MITGPDGADHPRTLSGPSCGPHGTPPRPHAETVTGMRLADAEA